MFSAQSCPQVAVIGAPDVVFITLKGTKPNTINVLFN